MNVYVVASVEDETTARDLAARLSSRGHAARWGCSPEVDAAHLWWCDGAVVVSPICGDVTDRVDALVRGGKVPVVTQRAVDTEVGQRFREGLGGLTRVFVDARDEGIIAWADDWSRRARRDVEVAGEVLPGLQANLCANWVDGKRPIADFRAAEAPEGLFLRYVFVGNIVALYADEGRAPVGLFAGGSPPWLFNAHVQPRGPVTLSVVVENVTSGVLRFRGVFVPDGRAEALLLDGEPYEERETE